MVDASECNFGTLNFCTSRKKLRYHTYEMLEKHNKEKAEKTDPVVIYHLIVYTFRISCNERGEFMECSLRFDVLRDPGAVVV